MKIHRITPSMRNFTAASLAVLIALPGSVYAQTDNSKTKEESGTVTTSGSKLATREQSDRHTAAKGWGLVKRGKAKPRKTDGAPYPATKLWKKKSPNAKEDWPPIPDGPLIGKLAPTVSPTSIKRIRQAKNQTLIDVFLPRKAYAAGQKINFHKFKSIVSAQPSTSLCCAEISVAQNGDTVILTGNQWVSISLDGGTTFNTMNPTTIFPEDNGGMCCDQVVQYVPEHDMFVWIMQYWKSDNKNRLRLAAQTTANLRNSNGTAWTYWDFPSETFSTSGQTLDYNDVAIGENSLWWSSDIGGQRMVARLPLSQIAAKSTIYYSYTPPVSNARFSHVSQNGRDTVYWGGHISNSELRVYSMKDFEGFYSWRSITVDSWPNNQNSSICPDGTDWLNFDRSRHYVFGNVVQGNHVWMGWLAAAGGKVPEPHIQLVKINTNTWSADDYTQIWNPKVAFGYPYLSTNEKNEIGMSVGLGGPDNNPAHAVGVLGDFVVHVPQVSSRCTTRWGDYNTARRSGSDPDQWVAGGYTMGTNTAGNPVQEPHYIRFSR